MRRLFDIVAVNALRELFELGADISRARDYRAAALERPK